MNERSHPVDRRRPGDAADQERPGDTADQERSGDTADQERSGDTADQERSAERQCVVVVTQDGMGVAEPPQGDDEEQGARRNPADLVEQPAKVMRLGTMIKQLLEEVKSAPLDEAGRSRLAEIHRRSLSELEQGLAPELVEELERITLPLTSDSPSEAELRIAQAQLVGWLEGLFHGIQTAIVAQQMAAQQQLQHMRLALPGGEMPRGQMPGGQMPGGRGQGAGQPIGPGGTDEGEPTGTGQYL